MVLAELTVGMENEIAAGVDVLSPVTTAGTTATDIDVLVGTDVDGAARSGDAPLVGSGYGHAGDRRAARADRGAAGEQGDGLGRAAVAGQRAEHRVGDADQVAVGAVGQAAGASGADQVGGAGRKQPCRRCRWPRAPLPLVLRATIVLYKLAEPAETSSPPPVPPLLTALYAIVALTVVSVPTLKMPAPRNAVLPAIVVFVAVSVPAL